MKNTYFIRLTWQYNKIDAESNTLQHVRGLVMFQILEEIRIPLWRFLTKVMSSGTFSDFLRIFLCFCPNNYQNRELIPRIMFEKLKGYICFIPKGNMANILKKFFVRAEFT